MLSQRNSTPQPAHGAQHIIATERIGRCWTCLLAWCDVLAVCGLRYLTCDRQVALRAHGARAFAQHDRVAIEGRRRADQV